tara:strand:- start:12332 stop:14632 length:2301 start_codon:yes stop_codon:yes gene_type:complete
MKTSIYSPSVLATTIALSIPSHASAETLALEEVVVTAQKRVQSLQDVPISVAAMTGDKLQEAGVPSLENFSAYVPNFVVRPSALGDIVSIRGIQSGVLGGIEQSVGTFVDGVYRGRAAQSRFGFLDVERVEVLRGPQSTLFGKNTIAGALNITSAAPTDTLTAEISAMYEVEHDETQITAHVSGPLTDSVRGRIAITSTKMDEGWIDNQYYNEDEPQTDEKAYRVSLDWDANEELLVKFKYQDGDWDNKGNGLDQIVVGPNVAAFHSLSGNGIADFDATPFNGVTAVGNTNPAIDYGASSRYEGDTEEYSINADYSINSGTFTAIYGHSEYNVERLIDADFTAVNLLGYEEKEEFDQDSLEIRFVSELGEGLEYIIGAYYQESDLLIQTKTQGDLQAALGTPFTLESNRYTELDQSTESQAVFAQLTYDISDAFTLTLGARYGEEEKTADQIAGCGAWDQYRLATAADLGDGSPGTTAFSCAQTSGPALFNYQQHEFRDLERTEEDWTYSANLSWDITEYAMVYATVSTGTKGGGFNNFALSLDKSEAEFEQEEVKSFEIGAKMSLLDGAAELNMAVFDLEYSDLQATIFTGGTSFIVENASNSDVRGFEADGHWQLSNSLMLRGSLGYTDFEYKDYVNAGCTKTQSAGDPTCVQDLSGGPTAFTPEWSGSLSIEHELELSQTLYLKTSLDLNYMGEHFTSPDNDPLTVQDDYTTANLVFTLGAQNDSWDISLVGRNITDEEFLTYSNDTPLTASSHHGTQGRLRF